MPVDSFAVQTAIYAALQPPLAALTPACALHDHAPENAAFPFVEISRVTRIADNYLAADASRYRVTLTVYSRYRGQKEVLAILDAISAELDDAALTLDAGTAVRCDLEQADTTRDADGLTFMGSAIFSILVEH